MYVPACGGGVLYIRQVGDPAYSFFSSFAWGFLSLIQSLYFWPLGMVAPSREEVSCSNSSLLIPFARLKSAHLNSASLKSARLKSALLRLALVRSASLRLASRRSAPLRSAPLRSAPYRL